jgi:hypothetical protein
MRPGKRRALREAGTGWGALLDQAEKLKASVRAKVEHPFRVIKRQFGHTKVRYRGLEHLRKVKAHLLSHPIPSRLAALIQLNTGMRISEPVLPRWPLQIPPPVATPNSPRQDGRIMTALG